METFLYYMDNVIGNLNNTSISAAIIMASGVIAIGLIINGIFRG